MTKRHRRGHLYRRGNIFWLQYMVDGKLIRESLGTDNKGEAERLRTEKMRPLLATEKAESLKVIADRLDVANVEADRLHDEANPPLTLAQAWDAYEDAENRPRRAGEATLAHYAGHLAAFTAWMKEHHPAATFMRDVTPEMASGFIRHLEKEKRYTGNRVNKYLQFLRTMFKVLAKPGRITANPFSDIEHREHLGNTKRPLTVEELKRIIESAEGDLKTLFMVGTFTGLRLADAATLKWGEVDLARAIIRRIPRKTARTGKAVIIGIPAILSQHLAGLERKGHYVTPEMEELYRHDTSMISRRISAHLEKCGIQTVEPGTGEGTKKRAVVVAGFHSLRHSFISMHAQAGTPQAVMQKLAGHGNPMMTEHYTHISESTARSAADALPVILGDAPALPERAPLPPWVRELIESMTAKNWRKVKAELLATDA